MNVQDQSQYQVFASNFSNHNGFLPIKNLHGGGLSQNSKFNPRSGLNSRLQHQNFPCSSAKSSNVYSSGYNAKSNKVGRHRGSIGASNFYDMDDFELLHNPKVKDESNLFYRNFDASKKNPKIFKQKSQNFFEGQQNESMNNGRKKSNPFNVRKISTNMQNMGLSNISVNEELEPIESHRQVSPLSSVRLQESQIGAKQSSGLIQETKKFGEGIHYRIKHDYSAKKQSTKSVQGDEQSGKETPQLKTSQKNVFGTHHGSLIKQKQDVKLGPLKQRPIKSIPKYYYVLRRNDAAKFQQFHAQHICSFDYSISDLQLIGSQFQNKTPEFNSSLLDRKRYHLDQAYDQKELLNFLKQKYLEQQEFLRKCQDGKSQNSYGVGNETNRHLDVKRFSVKSSVHAFSSAEKEKNSTLEASNFSEKPQIDDKKDASFSYPKAKHHRKQLSNINAKKNSAGGSCSTVIQPTQRILNSRVKKLQSTQDEKCENLVTMKQNLKLESLADDAKNDLEERDIVHVIKEERARKQIPIHGNQTRLRPKKTINISNNNSTQVLLSQQRLESESEKLEKMYKLQKQIRAKYNDISVSQRQAASNEPYKYIVIRGNNSELIKKCLDERNGEWQEITCTNTLFNFKWVPFSKGIRFDYLSGHGQRKMVNHFEGQDQISQKDTLFFNLQKYYEQQSSANRQNVFKVVPVTFVIDFQNKFVNDEIERFQIYYNMLEKHKGSQTTFADISGLNKTLSSHPLFLSNKYTTPTRYTLSETMFSGYNYWLLKPTDYNRGRGVQVFHTLDQFKKLIYEYQQGVEVKFGNTEKDKVEEKNIKPEQVNSIIPPEQMLANFTNLDNVPNVVKTNSFVIQKYLEKPLLIKRRKFDIRLWVLIAHDHKCYLFKEGYIRTSSFEFDITPESLDKPFIHLTNNAVQRHNENYGMFEEGNQLSLS